MLLGKRILGVLAALMVLFGASANAAVSGYTLTTDGAGVVDVSENATAGFVAPATSGYTTLKVVWGDGTVTTWAPGSADTSKALTKTYTTPGNYSPYLMGASAITSTFEQLSAKGNMVVSGETDTTKALRFTSPSYGASIPTSNSTCSFATAWRMSSVPSALSTLDPLIWVSTETASRSGATTTTLTWTDAFVFTTAGAYSTDGSTIIDGTFGLDSSDKVDLTKSTYRLTVTASRTTGLISATMSCTASGGDFSALSGKTIYVDVTWGTWGGVNAAYGDQNFDYNGATAGGSPFQFAFTAPATPSITQTVVTPTAPTAAEIAGITTEVKAGVGYAAAIAAGNGYTFTFPAGNASAREAVIGNYSTSKPDMAVTYFPAATAGQTYNMSNGTAVSLDEIIAGASTVDDIYVYEPAQGVIIFRLFNTTTGGATPEVDSLASGFYAGFTMNAGFAGGYITHVNANGGADGYPLAGSASEAAMGSDAGTNSTVGAYYGLGDGTYKVLLGRFGGAGAGSNGAADGGSSGCEMSSTGSAWALLPVALVLGALAVLALRRKEA